MKKLKIQLDFLSGPLWKDVFDPNSKKLVTGIDIIDTDEILENINQEIQDLYSSYYRVNYRDNPIYFSEEEERNDKYKMLTLLQQLNNRINELNDGNFTVEDLETPRVLGL